MKKFIRASRGLSISSPSRTSTQGKGIVFVSGNQSVRSRQKPRSPWRIPLQLTLPGAPINPYVLACLIRRFGKSPSCQWNHVANGSAYLSVAQSGRQASIHKVSARVPPKISPSTLFFQLFLNLDKPRDLRSSPFGSAGIGTSSSRRRSGQFGLLRTSSAYWDNLMAG